MISQIFFSLKIFLIKLSPFTWVDAYFLQRQRKRAYGKALEERVYILKLELEKVANSMIDYNTKWKSHERKIKVDIEMLAKFRFSDEITQNTADNFLQFLRKLNHSTDLEVKVSGLEAVISKIVDLDKQTVQKTIQSPNKPLTHYRTILNSYLAKTQEELKYLKIEARKEVLEEQLLKTTARLHEFRQTKSYTF